MCKLLFLIFVIFTPQRAWAQLKSNAQLTYIDMSGNVNSQTVRFDGEVKYVQEKSEQKIYGGFDYAEAEYAEGGKVTTANSREIGFKNHNLLTDIFYIQQGVELRVDEFQGYNFLINFNGGPGVVLKDDIHELKIEIGPGFIYEDRDDENKGYPSLVSFAKYTYKFSEHISGSSNLKHIRDLSDTNNHKTEWDSYALIKLTDTLSLKTGRELRYGHLPPKGTRKHDWMTYLTLVMDF